MMKQQIELDNKIYEVIATVHDDDTNKDFVLFTSSKIDHVLYIMKKTVKLFLNVLLKKMIKK